jgi:hypothetical protein
MVEIRAEDVERVAGMVHELLRGSLDAGSPYGSQSFEDLDSHIQEANRQQVLRAPGLLATLGFHLERDDPAPDRPAMDLTAAEVELASIAEHEGWMLQKLAAGYRYGAVRDDNARVHPSLVPWEQLSEPVRELDRQRVRLVPWIARELGLRVTRQRQDGHSSGPGHQSVDPIT